MNRPLIGIPCFAAERAGTNRPIYGNNRAYIHAIEHAGGAPVLIPLLESAESVAAIRARLDGLLLTGGGDIEPSFYGEARMPECGEAEPERDVVEIEFTRWALREEVPVLGVCRGLQVLNVVQGGTLYQDIATQRPGASNHAVIEWGRSHLAHDVDVDPDSHLAGVLGATHVTVNSLHHQAVNRLGDGLRVVARSEDGIVEGMELAGHPFVLAVQYHPEELEEFDEASRRLFAAFVEACRQRMAGAA